MFYMLDTDFYKFTTGQVVNQYFKFLPITYKLFDRKNKLLPLWHKLRPQIEKKYKEYRETVLTIYDVKYLRSLNIFNDDYISYLLIYGLFYDAEVNFDNGIEIRGAWIDCIFWEIPLLQIVNEVYCAELDSRKLIERIDDICLSGMDFAEFGTRRRQSRFAQDIAIQRLKYNGLTQTSNVYFAMKYDLTPVGSYPHELPMALSTIYGEENAQYEAIKLMKKEFPTRDIYALTDTYTTDLFLSRFWEVQELCAGVRHDSGNPYTYTDKIIQWYKDHGIDPKTRTILYTDNLNTFKKADIIHYVKGRIQTKFGIGTYLTNVCEDRPDSVIKLTHVGTKPVRKISDDPTKSIGNIL